ncbi:MAG: daunorubicin/doxorubicin resistance ABC transporter ATP-binding protein DrrA, partial [Solirubrobacterales bacterium]
ALSAPCGSADQAAEVVGELSRQGITVANFSLGQPSLDEVFLALTGHTAEDVATNGEGHDEEEAAA